MRPLQGPVITSDTAAAPFFDGAAEGALLLPRCAACAAWESPESWACSSCQGDDLRWQSASRTARLVSWTVVHTAPHPAFVDALPFVTALVEVPEGPWLSVRLLDTEPSDLVVGLALDVVLVQPDEGASYPVCQPRARSRRES